METMTRALHKEEMNYIDNSLHINNEELKECVRFHRHFCPGLAIGFRAAKELLRLIGVSRSGDEELVAIVETDACSADAMQVMTGCTFGKGNFIFLNYGKHAFTLGSRQRNIAFRASLRAGGHVFNNEFVELFEKMRSDSTSSEERAAFLKLRHNTGLRILDMDTERLFKIEEAAIRLPPKAMVVRSETCPVCLEPVRHDYLNDLNGILACPSCRKVSERPGKG